MYRHIAPVVIVALALVMAAASPGAAMEFSVDMNQDGTADVNWPLAAGDTVTVEVFVSDIIGAGLGAMGFILEYDETLLSVTAASVDEGNWPSGGFPTADSSVPGEIEFLGNRIPEVTGLSGDNILLATVTFERVGAGVASLQLVDRDPAQDDFVTVDDPPEVLDGDIGAGVSLATIQPPIPGDVSGDGTVDLADAVLTLQLLSATGSGIGFATGDVSGDSVVGIEEGIWILQSVGELR